jgi:biopolymer transport protein ExbD
MAEIIAPNAGRGKRKRISSPRQDMTPMVDLAFLLLTFFILASSLIKPKTMELVYPKENTENPMTINENTVATVLLAPTGFQDCLYYGMFEQPIKGPESIGNIQEKRLELVDFRNDVTSKNQKAFVAIKTDNKTPYRKVIETIDELKICGINSYIVQDMTPNERSVLSAVVK